ncbi:GNAT family N-acetyltransferase [Streptomyces sp. NPDC058665]|uniref:GNAT family N-acetyltransferase n=1 Tax=Streptomyces sp. NPDC058665 TaxID=3346586 RepID=UPI003660FB8A
MPAWTTSPLGRAGCPGDARGGGKLSCAELVDPARLSEALSRTAPVLDVLGPAALFYLERDGFVPASPGRVEKDDSAPAGYLVWPRAVAHLCVLVAPHRRRRGLAGIVASAAVSHALGAGLLSQWRARPYASRRVAVGLGFRELGAQLSVRM